MSRGLKCLLRQEVSELEVLRTHILYHTVKIQGNCPGAEQLRRTCIVRLEEEWDVLRAAWRGCMWSSRILLGSIRPLESVQKWALESRNTFLKLRCFQIGYYTWLLRTHAIGLSRDIDNILPQARWLLLCADIQKHDKPASFLVPVPGNQEFQHLDWTHSTQMKRRRTQKVGLFQAGICSPALAGSPVRGGVSARARLAWMWRTALLLNV